MVLFLICFGCPSVEALLQILAMVDPELEVHRHRLLQVPGSSVQSFQHRGVEKGAVLRLVDPYPIFEV